MTPPPRAPGAAVEPDATAGDDAPEGTEDSGALATTAAAAPVRARPVYETIPTFDELYRREWRYVAAVAERLMVRKADVRDVVQEVFIKAYRGLGKVENAAAVRGWLATITVRAVSDRLRRKKWQQTLLFQQEQIDDLPAHHAGPEAQAELRRLQRALLRLPVKERIAWGLRHIEGEPLERVAELCECSLATVKRRITAAQDKLRAFVRNEERARGPRGVGQRDVELDAGEDEEVEG